MNDILKPIALTVGEPAGIGPDIVLQYLQMPLDMPLRIFADPVCLENRAKQLGLPANLLLGHRHIDIEPISFPAPVITSELNAINAPLVIESIKQATHACLNKQCRALVTAPVHKGIINAAGIPFTGHTEFLAALTKTPRTVMMLVNESFKVALATTHIPLSKVSKAITESSLTRCIEIIDHDLQSRFHISSPNILVCGLNPHAGENGYIGDEEIRVIMPTLKKLRQKGYQLIGPVSADTAFTPQSLQNVDVVLAMYHDQGLPVVKTLEFGHTVNVTLGLPIVRTSVDHGVALPLAGTGRASADSLKTALQYADIL